MTKQELYDFIRAQDLAVLASVSPSNTSQAALVGIAVTPALELIFDTVKSSRKYPNLIRNPNVAFVIGWSNEITVQYEGEAEELNGIELQESKKVYFAKWPACRAHESWPGIVYFKVTPKWIRYSDYNRSSDQVEELTWPGIDANIRE
jgi:general stress protein 26